MPKFSLFGLIITLAFTGCASSTKISRPSAATLQSDAYATQYLGADGRIITKLTAKAQPQNPGWWKGDNATGRASIIIDLNDQIAYFYKGGQLVGQSPVSTGREGFRTPSGQFSIIQKDIDHHSNLYGDYVDADGVTVVRNVDVTRDPRPPGSSFRGSPMPYFMRIVSGVGLHSGYLPGVPDSHGCIRMPNEMAAIFYENAPLGTPVTVRH